MTCCESASRSVVAGCRRRAVGHPPRKRSVDHQQPRRIEIAGACRRELIDGVRLGEQAVVDDDGAIDQVAGEAVGEVARGGLVVGTQCTGQCDGARRPVVVERLDTLELEHPRGLGAIGAPRRAELAHEALVGHTELDPEFLHAHHHRGAVRLEHTEVRHVVHDGIVVGEHAELWQHAPHRGHGRVGGHRTIRTFEVREIGDREHHDQTDRDSIEPG